MAALIAPSSSSATNQAQAPDRSMPPSIGVLPPLKVDLACLYDSGLAEFRNGTDGDYEIVTVSGCGLEERVVRRHKINPHDRVSMPCHLAHLLKAKCWVPLPESDRE